MDRVRDKIYDHSQLQYCRPTSNVGMIERSRVYVCQCYAVYDRPSLFSSVVYHTHVSLIHVIQV